MAIKTWFLNKNNLNGFYGKELATVKETAKAVLVRTTINGRTHDAWVPKSCIIDEWEKDTSNFGYHDYLVKTLNESYKTGVLRKCNTTFKSGRNIYDMTSFTHQMKTVELITVLEENGIAFLNRTDWNNR